MISVEIEKEINQENKVFLNFNFRQLICIIILVVASFVFMLLFDFNARLATYPITAVAAILFGFGWYKQNGMPFEKVLFKKLQVMLYGSNIRKYKTKNQYVQMINKEYKRRKNIDMTDKKTAKIIQKEAKEKEKEMKEARKNSLCKPVL